MPRVILIALGAVTASLIGWLSWQLVQISKVQHVAMAAGASSGESYILGTALKKVVERHYSKVELNILETGGTVESLRLLEQGKAQFAAAQADVSAGRSAQGVAILFDDTFQLLVQKGSQAASFADLRNKRIALAQTGGQFQSFVRVADHFGLGVEDFHFIGSNDATADEAFLSGAADALFRVRALGNPAIERLVQTGKFRFLRIEQAAAMRIGQPAFAPAVIPQGAYMGEPAVPPEDLPTVAVHRLLLARDSTNNEVVRTITSVLIDRRQEVMAEIPPSMPEVRLLLGGIRKPVEQAGLGPSLHPGAASYYDKEKPSFILAHADYVGLLVTISLMIGSWVWELKSWIQMRQKNRADEYSRLVLELIAAGQQADSAGKLDEIRSKLLATLALAFKDFDADKISEESFHSFRSILQIALDVVKERRSGVSPRADSGAQRSSFALPG